MPDVRARLAETLGDAFVVERELGGGGMSRVFLVRDVALARLVVVKVLQPELAMSLSVERFRREILLVAALQHPHIVGVLAAGEIDGLPFFTMPYVQGESLRERLKRGPLPFATTVSVLRDVARALDCAHSRGIVHRDIKPDNVLLAGTSAMVADFGVAKALDAALPSGARTGTLTFAGTSLGTPQYMAPEQAAGDPDADHRVDLYAWGVMAYEMLAGRTPFEGRSPQQLLAAHLTETPVPPSTLRDGIPEALERVVLHCLEKDPDARPASAEALLELLDDPAIVSGAFASARSGSGANRIRSGAHASSGTGRRRTLAAAIVVGLLAAVAGAWGIAQRRGQTPPPRGAAARAAAAAAASAARSVAVLPLTIISDEAGDARLGAAIGDHVATTLARVRGLRVVPRSAAAAALAASPDPTAVARTLRVRVLFEGTLQREGDRVRVAARLLDASDGAMLWADVYDGTMRELFAMQDHLAQSVATAVGEQLEELDARAAER